MYLTPRYKARFLFANPHLQTIYPHLFRKVPIFDYQRERIKLEDGDFIDLDWLYQSSKSLTIICPGLESNSQSPSVRSLVTLMLQKKHDVVVFNHRGLSGKTNTLSKTYHSGRSQDLHESIKHINQKYSYQKIFILGISIGGNITLKYLGEYSKEIPKNIIKAVCFSVPLDLKSSAYRLQEKQNFIYMSQFLKTLKEKLLAKEKKFPGLIDLSNYNKTKSFIDFDENYTAKLNGFKSAEDYWQKASSINYLESIKVPSLILSSKDDSFLGKECYPLDICKDHKYLDLELTEHGGHFGFIEFNKENLYYHEKRCLEFIQDT